MSCRNRINSIYFASLFLLATGCEPVNTVGTWNQSSLAIAGGSIQLQTPQPLPLDMDAVKDWVQRAAQAVSSFYGRYPVKQVSIFVLPASFGGIGGGEEWNGERIEIHLGPDTTISELKDSWMLTHEMFHLSQPDFDDQYQWMSEGMADYLEPVARVRIGQITAERFWKDLVEGLPLGLPEAGDNGLDRTHTWGRTYWGGCLFWLMADIQIRQQTNNHKSIRDAAKAVLDAGGNGSRHWEFDDYLATADRGTATNVFKTLHKQQGAHPVSVDLPALWKSLGVIYENGQVTFDEGAPLAMVRTGITATQ
jgi:predicted metalloprotease with PDZ domain